MEGRRKVRIAFFAAFFVQLLLSLAACGNNNDGNSLKDWFNANSQIVAIAGTVVFLGVLTAFVFVAGAEKIARKIYELLKIAAGDTTGRFTVVAVFVAIAAAVGFALHTTDIFDKLKDSGYARGVITYLVTIATIGLAFILVLQAMFTNEAPDQFKSAREILTVMMGVLGTVVGFYFGSTTEQVNALRIAALLTSVTADNKERVEAFIEGGAPPYSYTLSFDGDKPIPITGQSTTGLISEEIGVATSGGIKLDVTDAKNGVTNKRAPAPAPSQPSAPLS